jgi:hypothetical protein
MLTPETLKMITEALEISEADAEALALAAAPLWRELGRISWTDAWGGSEFERVLPIALGVIRDQANIHPDGTTLPGWGVRVAAAQAPPA